MCNRVINGALFQRGGKFGRPPLWRYGQHDSFYSIEHSRSNFDVLKKSGRQRRVFRIRSAGRDRPQACGISKAVVRGCREISDRYWRGHNRIRLSFGSRKRAALGHGPALLRAEANDRCGSRPWKNAFTEYGGPSSAVRLRQVCELIQALRPGSFAAAVRHQ